MVVVFVPSVDEGEDGEGDGGADPEGQVHAVHPGHLGRRGQLASGRPADLARHNCIGIRQGDEAYGTLRLATGSGARRRSETVKTRGTLATNDGEIAVSWALDGHGILMRAEWDIQRYLRSGRLVPVLPQWETPEADLYAVYPQRLQLSTRVRAFVDFIAEAFAAMRPTP